MNEYATRRFMAAFNLGGRLTGGSPLFPRSPVKTRKQGMVKCSNFLPPCFVESRQGLFGPVLEMAPGQPMSLCRLTQKRRAQCQKMICSV